MRRGLLPLPLLLLLLLPAAAAEAGGAPEPPPGAAPRTTLRVLHLTDVHLDPAYAPGAGPAACAAPPCCRRAAGAGAPAPAAGRPARASGEALCDTPASVLQAALNALSADPPDLVVWTGDTAPHPAAPTESAAGRPAGPADLAPHLAPLAEAAATVRAGLPGVPVAPALGNRDFRPADRARPGALLGALAADDGPWGPWLPAEARAAFAYGGYYSYLHAGLGVRLVALNTEAFHVLNLHAFLGHGPALEQLAWLEMTLARAARAGEPCVVFGHVPPGLWGGFWGRYSERYEAAVLAHAGAVAAQLFGHQHSGSLRLLRPAAGGKGAGDGGGPGAPAAVAYVTPALTPYLDQHPSFRVFELGPAAGGAPLTVVDFTQYYLNTSAPTAADGATLLWRVGYSPRESLGLRDLTPASWGEAVDRMKADPAFRRRVQHLEANGAKWMGPDAMKAQYACGVAHLQDRALIDCANQNEEKLIRNYIGKKHTYVLTALFPFRDVFSHFCRALAPLAQLLPEADCPAE